MKRACYFILICLAPIVTKVSAQDNNPRIRIVYDPLFWKQELKLTHGQCERIQEINTDFYNQIIVAARSHANERNKAEKVLSERSAKIWDTFSTRQRRKWSKLEAEFENHELKSRSVSKHVKRPGYIFANRIVRKRNIG
jgi:hypothetical protein